MNIPPTQGNPWLEHLLWCPEGIPDPIHEIVGTFMDYISNSREFWSDPDTREHTLADLYFEGFCKEAQDGVKLVTDYQYYLQAFIVIVELYSCGQLDLTYTLRGPRTASGDDETHTLKVVGILRRDPDSKDWFNALVYRGLWEGERGRQAIGTT